MENYIISVLILKLLFILSIVFDALGDAYLDKHKRRNHEFENISTLALISVAIYVNYFYGAYWYEFASYILLRIGIFNWIYNSFRGLPQYYVGKSDKWFDVPIIWFSKIEENHFPILTAIYFICFFIGFCFGLNGNEIWFNIFGLRF